MTPARPTLIGIRTPTGTDYYSVSILLERHRQGLLTADHPAWCELRRLGLLSRPN
ncbi:hypothetical protein [Deinococcus marmoris]|uniref:Uncharacterized protein n=1 Tax=Deinococcus marmoris TaxID=249408 RepID=A0A1U7P316_9DEIO|nr:hypothetical protein [Deinococcus marmoris]OLV19550.1 hypothetical protein BOO71_0002389 [Deinococcus marmoris]